MATLEELAADIGERWSIFRTARDIVDTKFDEGREYAQDAFRVAQETITRLSDLASSLSAIDVNISTALNDITPVSLDTFVATAPVSPIIELNLPSDLTDTTDVEVALHDKIINDIVSGGPAISETVETDIFQRGLERDELLHQDELDRIRAEWSKTGFTLPTGVLAANITNAVITHINKRKDVSRDISIENFKLSDANTKFAIDKGIQWIANRIETYKAKIQAEISRLDAIVKAYLGQVEVYKGTAMVYTTLTDVQIKKFDAELKMALAKAELVIKDAELDMKNYELLNSLRIEAMKAISGVAAQLAAGSLSSVSAGAHISASNSASYSYSPPAPTD